MRLPDILSVSRTLIATPAGGRLDKRAVLRRLAELLTQELPMDAKHLAALLEDRERLQSTGIGDGVAIPHTSAEEATQQTAALLLCPQGVPFDAIDGAPVFIVFGVVGPRRSTKEHLKTLARVSRLLRSPETRRALLELKTPEEVFAFVEEQDRALG
ncbi:MAG: PTS sugar transporter subunit IIA [Myxococcales bacterium]|jgi:PTS system nitrogen regulatory IIA component|nr:PTS sugar transporter subunit IIA [Myxococcales bacterium]